MRHHAEVEHLFRHEYGRITSILTAKYSTHMLDQIEDAVQEALLKAMQVWAYQDMPENPGAWLLTVANNNLIDTLRRSKKTVDYDLPEDTFTTEPGNDDIAANGIEDDQLKMLYSCCHPALSINDQVMLSLKLMAGLSVHEIATALLKSDDAVKRAITRAKKRFKEEIGIPELPAEHELPERLDAVMNVLYLIFNEGYKATEGEQLIKRDLCYEAIRLADIIRTNDKSNTPTLCALMALMCFNASRFDARTDEDGNLVTLEHQDRTKWDTGLISQGLYFLKESSGTTHVSRYHIEAAIAAVYATSRDYGDIDWNMLLKLHNKLIEISDSSITRLNRIVVLSKAKGNGEALTELSELEKNPDLSKHQIYYAIKADLLMQTGKTDEVRSLLTDAVKHTDNEIEKRYLKNKLNSLQ